MLVLITEKTYDETGRKVSEKTYMEAECACMMEGKRMPMFDRHTQYECSSSKNDLVIAKA